MQKVGPCPHCGSDKTAAILYGLPAPEAIEQAKRGELVLARVCGQRERSRVRLPGMRVGMDQL